MSEFGIEKDRSKVGSRQPSRLDKWLQGREIDRRRNPWQSEFFANPFALMRQLSEDMERAFSGDFGTGFGETQSGSWLPAIDISERDSKMTVHADLPGLNKDDLKIEVANDTLIIKGERKREHEEHKRDFHRSERSYGSFSRSIPLPEGTNIDEVQAKFDNGVLEISIPIPESKRGREIPIEVGSVERKQIGSESGSEKQKSATR